MSAHRLDFRNRVAESRPHASRSGEVRTIMLNVGRRCELRCSHCHHRCGPDEPQTMTPDVMEAAIELARALRPSFLDVTGGSPELWPLLPELVNRASDEGIDVRIRTNLMALSRSEGGRLADLFASRGVTVLASVPGLSADEVDSVRGRGVFDRCVRALQGLAERGYGSEWGPKIELAWNPGRGLPQAESELHARMRAGLEPLGIQVERVRAIANVPLGRHGDRLRRDDDLETYLRELANEFDEHALESLPCREGVEVAWDGTLYDCDFNLAASLPLLQPPGDVFSAIEDPHALARRRIAFAAHCFACTVGSGSG